MPKHHKIKRYNKIYRTGFSAKKGNWKKIVGWTAAVLLLAFIGYSAYGPIVNWISGVYTGEKPDLTPSSSAASSDPGGEEPPATDTAGIYGEVDRASLTSEAAIKQAAATLKASGIDTAVIDLKDDTGALHYQSSNATATAANAVAASALNMKTVVDTFESEGIKVVARLSAYKDPLMAYYDRSAAVKYQSTDMLWLDGSNQPWLSPASDAANAYLSALCSELMDLGVTEIILQDLTYPSGFNMGLANYSLGTGVTYTQALQNGINTIKSNVEAKGGTLSIRFGIGVLLGEVNDVDYRTLSADCIYVDARAAAAGTVIGDYTVTAGSTEKEIAEAVVKDLQGRNGGSDVVVYSSAADTASDNRQFVVSE